MSSNPPDNLPDHNNIPAMGLVDGVFDEVLAPTNGTYGTKMGENNTDSRLIETRLIKAMRYSVLGGGKRFRAFLCCASAALFDVDPQHCARVAAAIECLHSYSLIHDDLPCMDDDDLRRGKPSLHKAFDEALAVLAGDALQSLAFDILAQKATHPDADMRLDLIASLAKASGVGGMVGGQVFDIYSPKMKIDIDGLIQLQQMKTGALICFAVEAGGILGGAEMAQRTALVNYATHLGLAYQIIDDLLDVEGTSAELGKTTGKDAAMGKVTFVSLLGAQAARTRAEDLIAQALAHLSDFGGQADNLRQAARFVLSRKN